MKKIKLLLGIGLLGALFSTCFSYDNRFFNIEYYSATNQFQNYILNGIASNVGKNFTTYYDGNWSGLNSFYRSTYITLDNNIFDISKYSLTGKASFNSASPYLYIQDNTKISFLYRNTSSSYGSYLFPLVSGVNSIDSVFAVYSGLYIRIFSDMSNCMVANPISNPVINGGCSDSSRVFVHYNTRTYDSSRGLIRDLAYGDGDWYKGSISSSVGNTYSFAVGIDPIISGNDAYINDSDFVGLRTAVPTLTGDYIFYNNLYLVRLNNLESVLDFSDFQVLAIFLTGNSDDTFDFLYSIYNCPYSADDISDCSFSEGGNILPSNLDNSFASFSGSLYSGGIHFSSSISNARLYHIIENFLFFLSLPANYNDSNLSLSYKVFTTYNSSSHIVNFSRPLKSNGNYFYINSYSAFLDSSANINVLDGLLSPGGNNGNQSSGSMAINTGLFNLCLTSPSFYDLNTIFCNRVFGGRDLSYVQGLISSGAYLQSYIDGSGNLVYVVDIYDEPSVLTGGVTWECYGDRCINTEFGSWGDVEPWEILHLSGGDILSSGYYLGFFESINETGYFFKCPYSYNNSRWIAGRSILNAIGRDPFLPINCFIAAYENGRRVKLFDDAFNGYSRVPLMNGDTQNHKNLFTFFDILLSVVLIFFLMKFYHLFK